MKEQNIKVMNNQIYKPHHVGISVNNLNESILWYRKILNFELESINDFSSIKSKIAFLRHGDFRIELFEHYETINLREYRKHPSTDMKNQGTKHIGFVINEDIKILFDGFKKNGVEVVMGPVLSPPKDSMMGFIRDNTGNLIEFIQFHKDNNGQATKNKNQ